MSRASLATLGQPRTVADVNQRLTNVHAGVGSALQNMESAFDRDHQVLEANVNSVNVMREEQGLMSQRIANADVRYAVLEGTVTSLGNLSSEATRRQLEDSLALARRVDELILMNEALHHRLEVLEQPVQRSTRGERSWEVDTSRLTPNNRSMSYEDIGAAIHERRFCRVVVEASVFINLFLRPQDNTWRLSSDAPPNCHIVSIRMDPTRVGLVDITIAHPSFHSLMSGSEIPIRAFTYTATEPEPEPTPQPNTDARPRIVVWRTDHV